MRLRLFVCLMAFGGLLVGAVSVEAVPVTFQVHMAQQVQLGYFDPASDFVDVAGSFNGWGGSPLTPLSDADGDTVYTVTVAGFNPGDGIEYKFRINGQWDGTEEFPGIGNNRLYTVLPDSNLIDVWYNDLGPGQGQVQPGPTRWWNDTVFYEIFVRSFQDSDGDGIGDLQGLTSRLDYLNDGDPDTTDDLGITGIWLMPINDAPSYHGYDSTDYMNINPDYGTMDDFEAFLAAAHARGIKVIIDFVMNHCSDQHPWFQASRAGDPSYRDWFRWSPDDPGETGPWGQQVWHWDSSGWYYGLFTGSMPDLNYDTPAVKDTMFATASWWLETIGVDGFRLDAVLYIDEDPGQLQTTPGTLQFWRDFGAQVRSVAPEAVTVGEAWTGSATVVQYVTDDRLDLCFEFDQSYALLAAANNADAGSALFKASQVYNLYPYLQYASFLTNHDQDRSFNALGLDEGRMKSAAALYLTLPGVPFVYYGEEIGMQGTGDHRYIRAPMQWDGSAGAGFTTVTPWQPVGAGAAQYHVQTETGDPQSLLSWYRSLIHARNGSSALRRGTLRTLGSSDPAVAAYLRTDSLQTVLCLVNLGGTDVADLAVSGLPEDFTQGWWQWTDLLDPAVAPVLEVSANHGMSGLTVPAHGARLLAPMAVTGTPPNPGTMGLRLESIASNPFNPSTTITYEVPRAGRIRLGVFDLKGREVAVLAEGPREPGRYRSRWDGRDRAGRPVGSGVYVACLRSQGRMHTARMLLLK